MSAVKVMSAEDVNKHVGQRIRSRRRALDMPQSALAARVGMSVPWVTLMESGQRNLTVAHLMAVAAVLGVNPGDLLPPTVSGG